MYESTIECDVHARVEVSLKGNAPYFTSLLLAIEVRFRATKNFI